jgi:glycosyltransferase involved in cell wall biosynthesis
MIEKNEIDVIHAQDCTVNFSGLLTRLGLDKMPVPLIYTVRGPMQLIVHAQKVEIPLLKRIAYDLFVLPLLGLERYSIRAADKVIAVSNYVAEDAINRFGVKPWSVSVVPNPVDTDKFYPDACVLEKLSSLADCPTILYVGGASPIKGVCYLLHAMRYLVSEKPNLRLLFVCGGNDKLKLTQLAERFGVGNYCVFLGRIPHDDMPKVYAASTVVVVPSLYESFSRTILEAMACGKPVVATKVGGIPELVVDNETGLLVEPRNAPGLAAAILRILENPQKAREMGSSGRERVKRYYAKNVIARKVLNVYERCVTESKS